MKKGVTIIFFANIINLLLSVLLGFWLPQFLSVDSYGYYKVFQLYVTYIGIAHMGYSDGVYIKYGGRSLGGIGSNELLKNIATIRNMQLAITIIGIGTAIVLRDAMVFLLALSLVPVNMISFYKSLYQATGEFRDYGIITIMLPIISFVCNLVLLMTGIDNYIYYAVVVIISNLIMYYMLEHRNAKAFGRIKFFLFDFKLLFENIKIGFTLMLGNFSSILITNIDRWCIQIWLTIQDFSYYSFAVSVENMFDFCVSAVTTTLYNYLCKVQDKKKIIKLKTSCIYIGIYLISLAFPVKWIIQDWIPKYLDSVSCLFYLMGSQLYFFVIKAIYINLYKARGQQRHYLSQMIVILFISIGFNVVLFFCISRTKEVFAAATLMTSVIWYFICYAEKENRDIRSKWQQNSVMILSTILFVYCGIMISNAIVGGILYLLISTVLILVFEPSAFSLMVRHIKK